MPTNGIKHKMLKEAKRIAGKEYKPYTVHVEETGIDEIISVNEQINRNIALILRNHPEFDEDEFKRMIRTFELRNKELVEIPND